MERDWESVGTMQVFMEGKRLGKSEERGAGVEQGEGTKEGNAGGQ